MKMTLLEMVQNILSAMDAEEVNSYADTVESLQIANEIRTTYYEFLNHTNIQFQKQLIKFEGLGDSINYPHILRVKDTTVSFDWVKYNVSAVGTPNFEEMCFYEPSEFMLRILRNTEGTLQLVKDLNSGVQYKVRSDKNPEFYTMFDNKHLVFDSYNTAIESSLHEAKVMAYGQVYPVFTLSDSFIPELQPDYFPEFLAEAKSACFVNYKGVANSKEEQRSRRQKVRRQNNTWRNGHRSHVSTNNYGRS